MAKGRLALAVAAGRGAAAGDEGALWLWLSSER